VKKSLIAFLMVFSLVLSCAGVSLGAVIYQEGFELNDGGYTHSGTGDVWQWGTPSAWPNAAATGFSCWGTNLGGNYLPNSNSSLYSSWIDLTSYSPGTTITLKWKQALHMESYVWDQAYCYGRTESGDVQLWQYTGGGIIQEGWNEKTADISFAAGKQFRVFWRVTTDSVIEFSGLYIDDVTIEVPIEKATIPSPEDGSLDVAVDPTLSWVHSGDVSFDVYLGTVSNDLPLLAGGISEMSYAVSDLDNSTTYYWRVDVRSGDLGISGDVWSFTTEEGGCIIPTPGGGSGGCNAAGLTFFGLILLAPLGLLRRKSR
jgi:Synergist-CTERM protein sorting domain-containing protein